MKIACCLAFMLLGSLAARAASCESLASLALPDSEITLAKTVAAGEFTLPGASAAAARQYKELPAFCGKGSIPFVTPGALQVARSSSILLAGSENSEHLWHALFEDLEPMCQTLFLGEFTEPGSVDVPDRRRP